jgi:hypothetical protein
LAVPASNRIAAALYQGTTSELAQKLRRVVVMSQGTTSQLAEKAIKQVGFSP